jgi:hypothetical protein
MPPYSTLNLDHFFLMVVLGLGITALVVLGRGAHSLTLSLRKRSEKQIEEEVHEFGGGVREGNGPVPILMLLVCASVLVWAVAYVLLSGARGL